MRYLNYIAITISLQSLFQVSLWFYYNVPNILAYLWLSMFPSLILNLLLQDAPIHRVFSFKQSYLILLEYMYRFLDYEHLIFAHL